jgi:glycosyltransferase involved in cell wall biosynthesis
MKILHINKFLYPRGGAETYLLALSQLQREHNDEVIYFSQHHPDNIACEQAKYFLPNLELGSFSFGSVFKIGRMFWSRQAARAIKQLLIDEKPDIVHIHNIYHQISPSILPIIKRAGIPIVMTVHDFKLITPNYTLRADNKHITHRHPIAHLIMSLEFYFHRLLNIYAKHVDYFIAPSNFVKTQLVKHGFDHTKIGVVPHFVTTDNEALPVAEKYILSFGRLDESKGFDTLIRAYATIATTLPLVIAGAGPEGPRLRKLTVELGLKDRVKFVGKKSVAEIKELIGQSLCTIFPSRVHETFGLGVIESYAHGKPVIATRAGAFSETVEEGASGLLYTVDDTTQLAQHIQHLIKNPALRQQMGARGQTLVRSRYNPENHYRHIQEIYDKAINSLN